MRSLQKLNIYVKVLQDASVKKEKSSCSGSLCCLMLIQSRLIEKMFVNSANSLDLKSTLVPNVSPSDPQRVERLGPSA